MKKIKKNNEKEKPFQKIISKNKKLDFTEIEKKQDFCETIKNIEEKNFISDLRQKNYFIEGFSEN